MRDNFFVATRGFADTCVVIGHADKLPARPAGVAPELSGRPLHNCVFAIGNAHVVVRTGSSDIPAAVGGLRCPSPHCADEAIFSRQRRSSSKRRAFESMIGRLNQEWRARDPVPHATDHSGLRSAHPRRGARPSKTERCITTTSVCAAPWRSILFAEREKSTANGREAIVQLLRLARRDLGDYWDGGFESPDSERRRVRMTKNSVPRR